MARQTALFTRAVRDLAERQWPTPVIDLATALGNNGR